MDSPFLGLSEQPVTSQKSPTIQLIRSLFHLLFSILAYPSGINACSVQFELGHESKREDPTIPELE